jgi:hypothetical protein
MQHSCKYVHAGWKDGILIQVSAFLHESATCFKCPLVELVIMCHLDVSSEHVHKI